MQQQSYQPPPQHTPTQAELQRDGCLDRLWVAFVDQGLAPWIPMCFLSSNASPSALQAASVIGTLLSIGLITLNWYRYDHFNSLRPPKPSAVPARDIYGLSFPVFGRLPPTRIYPKVFDGLTVLSLFFIAVLAFAFPKSVPRYSNILTWVPFAGGVWLTFAIGEPFTTQYAKEETPQATWTTPVFLLLNRHISLMWGACLSIAACSVAIPLLSGNTSGVLDFFTVDLIPILLLVAAVYFTAKYPEYYMEHYGAPQVQVPQPQFAPQMSYQTTVVNDADSASYIYKPTNTGFYPGDDGHL